MSKRMPVIIQSIVYRKIGQEPEVLLLKRSEERGGFWSVINGTLEFNESAVDCRKRELLEETSIQEPVKWSDEIHRFSFSFQNDIFVTVAFAAEVAKDQKVVINDEHTEFQWAHFEKALKMVKFDDDKDGLRELQKRLINNEI